MTFAPSVMRFSKINCGRIGPKIFLCTPRNISVAGTIDLDEDEQED